MPVHNLKVGDLVRTTSCVYKVLEVLPNGRASKVMAVYLWDYKQDKLAGDTRTSIHTATVGYNPDVWTALVQTRKKKIV